MFFSFTLLQLNHNSDNIGQVYQDEENMAAILMRRHEVTGDLVMVSTIIYL